MTTAPGRPAKEATQYRNGRTCRTVVPSVLLTPEWVTASNMNDTVVKDQFVPAQQLCTGSFAAACKANGISV